MNEPPSDSWLFAQAIQGNRFRLLRLPPRQLTGSERLVEVITGRGPDVPREPTYAVVSESYFFVKAITGQPLDERLRHATDVTPDRYLREARWNSADHPRGGFPQNRGWFSRASGAGGQGRGDEVAPNDASVTNADADVKRRPAPQAQHNPSEYGPRSATSQPGEPTSHGSDAHDRPTQFVSLQTADSVSNSIVRMGAQGDVDGLATLIDTGGLNKAQEQLARSLLQRLRSSAQQIIAKECKGSIHKEFPRELYNTKLKQIIDAAKGGDAKARKALKLLNDKRFKKG